MPRPDPNAPVRRVIDTCLWRDPKVMALGKPRSSPLMLFLFLTTHPSSGRIPGVLVETLPSLAGALGWRLDTTKENVAALEAERLIHCDWDRALVWIPNAIKYNRPSGAGEMELWAREWRAVPQCPLKDRIAADLADFLAPAPKLAAAFAKHCLGLSVVSPRPPAPVPPSEQGVEKARAKPKGRPSTEAELAEAEFQTLWALYPKRAGSNPRKAAFQHFCARRRQGVALDEMKAGLDRYVLFCAATDKVGTETVMQASRFFGTSEPFREPWELPKGHVITLDLKTSPDFERVFAAFSRQDGKAEAWNVWQRIEPAPTGALADEMIASIADWNRYQWPKGREAFVMPFAKWLKNGCWHRKFPQSRGRGGFEETAARFGAAAHANGNTYDGEVVTAAVVPTSGLPVKPEPFDLNAIPARRAS